MLFEQVKERFNLADFIAKDLGEPARHSGQWTFWLCPFHQEKTASFGVSGNSFKCWGCKASGTVIDFYQRRHNLPDALTAARELAQLAGIEPAPNGKPNRPAFKHIPAPDGVNLHAEPPAADWQDRAGEALPILQSNLQAERNTKARQWLARRGIGPAAIERYKLGFSEGGNLAGLYFERGITIPHIAGGRVYAVNVRRPVKPGEADKYKHVSGGKPGAHLFNGDALAGADTCYTVEGELDCIALQAAIGDRAAVITLGSKTAKITPGGLAQILPVECFYIATDAGEDEAAANYWLNLVGRRGIRVSPPGGCKDVCQAIEAGFDLAQWAADCEIPF